MTGNKLNLILKCTLAIGGMVGFGASFVLAVEKFLLLQNPAFEPSCNINPLLSCGSVMITPQASVFGFPNPLLGIAGFAIVMTIGMAVLAGASFKRWFWLGLQVGAILGVIFIHWLFSQSVYVIGALCPYCMVVWAVMMPIFWYTTLYNLHSGNIRVPKSAKGAVDFIFKNHGLILASWFVVIAALIFLHFSS